jgi:hypothetical protein
VGGSRTEHGWHGQPVRAETLVAVPTGVHAAAAGSGCQGVLHLLMGSNLMCTSGVWPMMLGKWHAGQCHHLSHLQDHPCSGSHASLLHVPFETLALHIAVTQWGQQACIVCSNADLLVYGGSWHGRRWLGSWRPDTSATGWCRGADRGCSYQSAKATCQSSLPQHSTVQCPALLCYPCVLCPRQ